MGILLGFSLVYFLYLYFFPFAEGISEAPFIIKATKDLIVGVFLAYVFWRGVRRDFSWRQNAAALGVAAALILPLVAMFFISPQKYASLLDIKNFIFGVAFGLAVYFWYGEKVEASFARWSHVFLGILAFQVAWSMAIIFLAPERNLWPELDASGLFGNPNTFALYMNLGVAVVLSRLISAPREKTAWGIAFLVVFLIGVLLSNSLSGLLVFLGLVTLSLVLGRTRILVLSVLTTGAICGAFLFALQVAKPKVMQYEVHRQLLERAQKVLFAKHEMHFPKGESLSFSYRRQSYAEVRADIQRNPIGAIFGYVNGGEYRKYDGGWLVMVSNFGFLITLLILALNGLALRQAYLGRHDQRVLAFGLGLVTFLMTFIFSRVLDYFPANLFYWFILAVLILESRPRTGLAADLTNTIRKG